jgi:hypothetical protein
VLDVHEHARVGVDVGQRLEHTDHAVQIGTCAAADDAVVGARDCGVRLRVREASQLLGDL